MIVHDYATTGDGLLTALRVFETVRESRATLNELTEPVQTYPQLLVQRAGLPQTPL